jgi:predicted extracellular nuclease
MLLFAGCTDSTPAVESAAMICQSEVTPIPVLQGDGYSSPYAGSESTVRGIVTYVVEGDGFYIEESKPQRRAGSSKALFVAAEELSRSVQPGLQLELSGLVSELGSSRDTLTSLTDLSSYEICAENLQLPLTQAELPLNSAEREALEGMRLSFDQQLTVTDVYNLFRGELTLSSSGVLWVPTEIRIPGPAAMGLERENRNQSLVAILGDSISGPLSAGSTFEITAGLLGHNGRKQQLFLDSARIADSPATVSPAPPADSSIRIVSSNLLNFFNGDGKGSGFPTERGAESLDEFKSQSARIHAAMTLMQPDLLAVQELENDGFGPDSAAHALLSVLNDTGNDDWAFVEPEAGRIGGDVITVGLFYRQQALESIGPARVLDGPEFRRLSRQPLAQLFRERRTGESFLVVVNHLKSKGRCPDGGENSDQQDGQGCWNFARVSAVRAQASWLEQLAAEMGTDNLIILGDMNAWRNEDPIRQFREFGYADLVEQLSGLPQYSYLYWGQIGTLDYAFASPTLAEHAKRAEIWHINANWPQKMEQPQPWLRASDHDPVIVDLDFSHSPTSD